MNVLSIPHEPTPLVLLDVFLPHGRAVSEASRATWRDAAWNTFCAAAHPKLKSAVERLLADIPYADLIVIRDVTDRTDLPSPAEDPVVASSAGAHLLDRIANTPRFAIGTRNADHYDPLPLVLAWTTAVGIAAHEGGVVYAPRFGRLWDPRVEPMPRLESSLPIREFVTFTSNADARETSVATTGLASFGIPDISWRAPPGTDAASMRNLLVGAASALLRLRRTAARDAAGQTTLDVPAMLPVLFGDLANAYGMDASTMTPPPETELARVPLDLSTEHELVIRTNASASALNDWLAGVRESAKGMRSAVE